MGVSCHDFGALKVAAEHPWVDVIFARVNYKCGTEYSCDGTVEEVSDVLKTARKNGKAVVGMKIFGAGKLTKPEEKDASLKYVFTNDLVDAITVGMLKTRGSRRHLGADEPGWPELRSFPCENGCRVGRGRSLVASPTRMRLNNAWWGLLRSTHPTIFYPPAHTPPGARCDEVSPVAPSVSALSCCSSRPASG